MHHAICNCYTCAQTYFYRPRHVYELAKIVNRRTILVRKFVLLKQLPDSLRTMNKNHDTESHLLRMYSTTLHQIQVKLDQSLIRIKACMS